VVTAVVAVVEGAARDVPAPEGVTVVRAPGSGDDALVAEAGRLLAAGADVLVVTADRGLRARLPAGVPVTGPGRLLAALPG
jgi:rRNA-processing protein FCF1